MAFCRRCGAQIPNQNLLCPYCGTDTCLPTAPSYPQPYPPASSQRANAAITLGIIGIISAFLLALIGHVTSIIGIVLGAKEYRATGKVAGLVLSIIGEACSILSSVLGMLIMTNALL